MSSDMHGSSISNARTTRRESFLHLTSGSTLTLTPSQLYAPLLPFIKSSPVSHHMTIFIAALTPLYRTHLLRSQPMTIPATTTFMEDDRRAAQHGINAIRNEPYDKNDLFRGDLLAKMVTKVFGQHEAHQGESTSSLTETGMDATAGGAAGGRRPKSFSMPHAFSSQQNTSNSLPEVKIRPPSSDRSIPTEASISLSPSSQQQQQQQQAQAYPTPGQGYPTPRSNSSHGQFLSMGPPQGTPMEWSEHRIAHLTAHEDLRDLVHEVFSPAVDPWTGAESNQYPG